jgi:hypothetical protein
VFVSAHVKKKIQKIPLLKKDKNNVGWEEVAGAGSYFCPCWLGREWRVQVVISAHVGWVGNGGGK